MEKWKDWEAAEGFCEVRQSFAAVGVCHSLHALARLATEHNASPEEFRSAALAYFHAMPGEERCRNPIAMMFFMVKFSEKSPLEIAHDIADLLSATMVLMEGKR